MTRKKKENTSNEQVKITVIPFDKQGGLAEIYQSNAVKMSLVEKTQNPNEFREITARVVCADFLTDAYSASNQKTKFAIYGFSWDGTQKTPDLESVNIHIVWPSKQTKEFFIKNLHFIHAIEEKNGIEKTQFHDLDELTGIIIGNKAWIQNCLTTRLYFFLFRCFSYEFKTNDWITEMSKMGVSDSQYVQNLPIKSWNIILNNLSSIHTDYFCGFDFKKDGTSTVHHNSGFFSTFSTHREQNPASVKKGKHWNEMKARGFETFVK